MQLKPVFDAGWALGFGIFGSASMIILIPLSILVEAIIIRQIFFKTERLREPLKISFIINLVSGAIGWIIILPYILNHANFLSIRLTGNPTTYDKIDPLVENYLLLAMIIGSFIFTVVIEGILLTWYFYKKYSVITIWLSAVTINIISYVGVALIGSAGLYFYSRFFKLEMIALACVYALLIYLLFSLFFGGWNKNK